MPRLRYAYTCGAAEARGEARGDARRVGAHEVDTFCRRALTEVRISARNVSAYAALLEAQLAHEPTLTAVFQVAAEVRERAEILVELIDSRVER